MTRKKRAMEVQKQLENNDFVATRKVSTLERRQFRVSVIGQII